MVFRDSALFDFLGRPEGNGRRRRPTRVSNFATNLSLPNGRPRLVHKRNRASCCSSSASVNKCRHRCASICLFHSGKSSSPVGALPSQCGAALLQGQRHALRRSRARTRIALDVHERPPIVYVVQRTRKEAILPQVSAASVEPIDVLGVELIRSFQRLGQ